MRNKNQATYYWDREQFPSMEGYEKVKEANLPRLFFICCALILFASVAEFIVIPALISAQVLGVETGETGGMVMMILIGAGMLGAIIYTGLVRSKSLKFKNWMAEKKFPKELGPHMGETRGAFGRILNKTLKIDFKKRYPKKVYDNDKYFDQLFKEYKIEEKINKSKELNTNYDPKPGYAVIKEDFVYDDIEGIPSDNSTSKEIDPIKEFLEKKLNK